MKKIIIISILAILTAMAGTVTATDYPEEYLGLPGDNLNLYATMKLFQESETLEGFERSLNDQNSHINNLDLNGDNFVDYVSVMDYVDGNVHTIVLRTQLNSNETQDIAVFTVQRFEDGTARIQLIGDEALYGPNYIVEPIYADSQETPNPGYMGSTVVVTTPAPVTVTTYEVAAWPIIRFIYRPGYVCWLSSWRWGYYPSYWNPWRPYYWHTYYGYHSHFSNYYYAHYRYWNHYRYHRYHDFYYNRVRSYSTNVNVRIRQGNYRTTYSRPDLRKRGDDLYRTAARRTTGYRTDNSNTGRTNGLKSARNTSIYNSNSGRRVVSGNSSRTRTNSQVNKGSGNTRNSSTIRSGRSTTNSNQGNKNAVSQGSGNRSTSSYRNSTNTSTNIKTGIQQKSSTIRNNRTSGSASARQNYRQPNRSSVYSNKSATKPKVSSRSSRAGSSYRQPKVSSRSSNSKSISRPKLSSGSRSSGVTNRSSRNSGSRSSGVTNRSSQSRSSSAGRSGRR